MVDTPWDWYTCRSMDPRNHPNVCKCAVHGVFGHDKQDCLNSVPRGECVTSPRSPPPPGLHRAIHSLQAQCLLERLGFWTKAKRGAKKTTWGAFDLKGVQGGRGIPGPSLPSAIQCRWHKLRQVGWFYPTPGGDSRDAFV